MLVVIEIAMWVLYWFIAERIFEKSFTPKAGKQFWFLLLAPIVIHYLLTAIQNF